MHTWQKLIFFLAIFPVMTSSVLGENASSKPEFWRQVYSLEDSNNLQAAADLLKSETSDEAKQHLEVVAALLSVTQAPESYRLLAGKELVNSLRLFLPKLNGSGDKVLRALVYREISSLENDSRKIADARAARVLEAAEQALKHKEFDRASALFTFLAASSEDISPELRLRANLGKLDSDLQLSRQKQPSFLEDLKDSARKTTSSLLLWTLAIAMVLGLIVLASKLKHLFTPKPGIRISFYDLSSTQADKLLQNSILNLELQRLLSPIHVQNNDEPIQVDRVDDIDGTFIGSIRPLEQPALAEQIIRDDEALKIGPISLNARQFIRFVSASFERPYEQSLQGTLVTENEKTIVVARLCNALNKTEHSWTVTVREGDSRAGALREMAARCAIHLSHTLSTGNWQSYERYRAGLDILSGFSSGESAADPNLACEYFQTAVTHDPENWLARLHLANTLRRCGKNEAAVQNFVYLESVLKNDTNDQPPSLVSHVQTSPEFPQVVQYGKAVALSKIAIWDTNIQAMEIFRAIASRSDPMRPAQSASEPAGLRVLYPLALGGLTVCLAFEAEQLFEKKKWLDSSRDKITVERTSARIEKVFCEMGMLVHRLESPVAISSGNGAVYLNSALAAALNSYARVLEAYGDKRQALEHYERANTLLPDFVDPYINLASLYIDSRKTMVNWVERAKSRLAKALELNPANYKAHVLLGRLLSDGAVQQFDEAIKELQMAGPVSQASFFLSRIYDDSNYSGRNPDQAIKELRKSIALNRRYDYRYIALIDLLLKQASAAPELLSEARSLADKLEKKGEAQRFKKQAKLRLSKIDDILRAKKANDGI
jgi:tetratricopeptide (TPR) repeat protein